MSKDRAQPVTATVVGLALRGGPKLPMAELAELRGTPEGGLAGDGRGSTKRAVTFVSRSTWDAVCREVGTDLPWTVRRANVCVEGVDLLGLVGRRVRVGGLVVDVMGETRPCGRMEDSCSGLERALKPAGRGGVYGSIVAGGTIRVGDDVAIVSDENRG